MTTYSNSERLRAIADKVISENKKFAKLRNGQCRIAYQMSNEKKTNRGKTVYADTEKVKPKLKEFLPFDFIVTFYEPNIVTLSEEKLERLMYHELSHVGFDLGGKFYIVPHDVEDFREIVEKWTIDWL